MPRGKRAGKRKHRIRPCDFDAKIDVPEFSTDPLGLFALANPEGWEASPFPEKRYRKRDQDNSGEYIS